MEGKSDLGDPAFPQLISDHHFMFILSIKDLEQIIDTNESFNQLVSYKCGGLVGEKKVGTPEPLIYSTGHHPEQRSLHRKTMLVTSENTDTSPVCNVFTHI